VPLGLEHVAVDRVLLGLGREQLEVHRLAATGADAGGHEHQPGMHLGAQRGRVGGQELAGLLGQVQQDGVAVERLLQVEGDFEGVGRGVEVEVEHVRIWAAKAVPRLVSEPS